jgi:hypothetical protein
MRRLLFALALWAMAPLFARAQEAAPVSVAESLIASAGAADVFAPAPDRPASVRHLGSGLTCHFPPDGAGGRLVLIAGLPRGDDVACEFTGDGLNLRLYATRLPRRASLQQLIGAVEQAVRRGAPNATPYAATLEIAAGAGLPAWRSTQFLIPGENGARDYLRVSVAQIGAWTLKMRYRAPAADDAAAQRLEERSELTWRGMLNEITR